MWPGAGLVVRGGVFGVFAARLHPAVARVDVPFVAGVGGYHVQPAAAGARGRLILAASAEAHDQLVDAVGGELRGVLGDGAGRALRVGPVNGGLVRLAAGPERERGRRGYERCAVKAGIGGGQGLHQRGMARAEPGKQFGIGRAALQDLWLRVPVEDGGGALDEVPCRPPVDVAGVAQQVLDEPRRAWRDRCVQAGPLGRAGEQGAVAA